MRQKYSLLHTAILGLITLLKCNALSMKGAPQPISYSDPKKAACQSIWNNSLAFRNQHVNDQSFHIRPPVGRPLSSVLNIHVGKTCGSTIETALQRSHVRYTPLHVFNVADNHYVNAYKNILLSIRDPITRTISGFNFHHPESKGKVEGGGPTKRGNKLFYECFKTIEDYAQALNETGTLCGKLARHGYGHMRLGLCHYVGGMREALLRKPNLYVIEQEHCTAQLKVALQHLNQTLQQEKKSSIVQQFNMSLLEKRRVNSMVNLPTKLSADGEQKLRKFLEDQGEYDLYYELRDLAVKV